MHAFFLLSADFFLLFCLNFVSNGIRTSNSLDPGQAKGYVRPKLFAKVTSRQQKRQLIRSLCNMTY